MSNELVSTLALMPETKSQQEVFVGKLVESVKQGSISPLKIESTTGYSCPNCGAICSDKTLISRTEAEFEELPYPHYSWEETHKCQKCETLYLLHNGT